MTGGQNIAIPAAFSQILTGLECVGAGIWVKCDANAPSSQSALAIHCPSNAATAVGFTFNADTINVFGDSGTATVTTIFTAQRLTKQWMHVYAETDLQQGRHRLYVNGVLAGDAAAAFNGTTIAAGAGGISYIGANRLGASSFVGFARDLAVVPRRMTAAEVMALYQEGAAPAGSYSWLCDDGQGSVAVCTQDSAAVTAFDGTLSTAQLFSREVPFSLAPLDRDAGYCVRLDGSNDNITTTASPLAAKLLYARHVFACMWVRLDAFPASLAGIYMPDGAGGLALRLTVSSAGQVDAGGRSRTGGTAVGHVSALPTRPVNLRQWVHIAAALDYTAKTIRVYANGVLCGMLTGIAWEDDTYQADATGNFTVGVSSNPLAGYIDDVVIGVGELTPEKVRSYYITGLLPENLVRVLDWQFNEGVGTAPQDSSGNGFHGAFSGITAPFGYFPNSYMS